MPVSSSINPSDYYFCAADKDWYEEFGCYEDFGQVPETDVTVFFITPRDYYDHHNHLYDGSIRRDVLPEGFGECMEGCYEAEVSKENGRQILLNAGFVEKKMY